MDTAPPIPLQPASGPPTPRLPGAARVIAREDIDDTFTALAADLIIHASNCVRQFGDFHLALSGGSTPMPFYRRLMVDPAYRDFPWKRTHLWMVDERRVPPEDDRFNYKHINEILVEHSDIPKANAHPMEVLRTDADAAYEKELRAALSWREKGHDRLDFVLLGMGNDGHTASLFPNSPAIDVHDRLVVINSGPKVTPPDRVTMTYRTINAARFIAVLVSGDAKRAKIAELAGGKSQVKDLPIAGIRPVGGELRWYTDWAALPRP